jgi:hypothetical protein
MSVQKIVLDTDYHDYYDHWFLTPSAQNPEKPYPVFSRKVSSGLHRIDQFLMLKKLYYKVIPYFIRVDHTNLYFKDLVVVYTDPMRHSGGDKVLVTLEEELDKYNNLPCTRFIKTAEEGSVSKRELYIGNYLVKLTYTNKGDWRTNMVAENHEVDIQLDSIEYRPRTKGLALYAVDFVRDYNNTYAIDYNTAPGLKGQEIDKILQPDWVAAKIGEFLAQS